MEPINNWEMCSLIITHCSNELHIDINYICNYLSIINKRVGFS